MRKARYEKLDISDFDSFDAEQKKYSNGILRLRLRSWDEFCRVIKIFDKSPDYFWRGQEKNWPLYSSLDRHCAKREKERSAELKRIFNALKLRLFELPEIRNKVSPPTEEEIWAIGQHYGLITPLLDWTGNPYIAAYFAFYKKGDQKPRIVYALNRALQLHIIGKNRFVTFTLPRDNFDDIQNDRLQNQRGGFTFALEGQSIKQAIKRFWKKTRPRYIDQVILAELLIPGSLRKEYLDSLRDMKITHTFLFPDRPGAIDACRIDLDLGDK